jgi:hypothetical protein
VINTGNHGTNRKPGLWIYWGLVSGFHLTERIQPGLTQKLGSIKSSWLTYSPNLRLRLWGCFKT